MEVESSNFKDSEISLVQLAIQGDKEAFHQIYNDYAGNIFAYIFFSVDNQAEAEELTGQVFLEAWKSLGQFDNKKLPLLGWLYTLALKQVISYKSLRNKNLQAPLNLTEPENSLPQTLVKPSDKQGAHKEACNLKTRQAIYKLPFDHQIIIYLRHFEGLNINAICYLIGKPENAIAQILFQSYHLLWQSY